MGQERRTVAVIQCPLVLCYHPARGAFLSCSLLLVHEVSKISWEGCLPCTREPLKHTVEWESLNPRPSLQSGINFGRAGNVHSYLIPVSGILCWFLNRFLNWFLNRFLHWLRTCEHVEYQMINRMQAGEEMG